MKLAAAAALTFIAALTIACGSSSPATPTPSASSSATLSATPSATPHLELLVSRGAEVHVGPSIEAGAGTVSLLAPLDQVHEWVPIGAYGNEIVLWASPGKSPVAETEVPRYFLWDPATGSTRLAWTGDPGTQDNYAGSDGDWLATVRSGLGSYGYGALILRNLKTGETRQLTASDTDAGYNTCASVSNEYVVWTEGVLGANAVLTETVQLYDIATATTTTLALNDRGDEKIWSAGVGGDKVEWLYKDSSGLAIFVMVHDLASGQETKISLTSGVNSAGISRDGHYVVWDDGSYDKHVIDLTNDQQIDVAHAQGWGVYVTDRYFSWGPFSVGGPDGNHPAGVYDLKTNELRVLPVNASVFTSTGHVMGHWFVWQSVPVSNGIEDRAQGKWYALPLPG